MTERQASPGPRGQIELICGCMFSGKSERLIHRITEAHQAGQSVAAFKHADDDRYASGEIVTHTGQRTEALPLASAARIPELAGQAKVVVIDEAQFFGDALVEVCRTLVQQGRHVVVAGLDRDSWGQPFGPMPAIEALAEQVIRTRAVCARCGAEAQFTQRLAPIEDQKMIGGPESYEPRCERCFVAPPIELRR